MVYKIKYYFEYKMDYGGNTKRYGSYVLDNKNLQNSKEAKDFFLDQLKKNEIELNPVLNITKGKIISKSIFVDEVIDLI